eukprot:scaffold1881_cov256-Pinguiococcus_pyrenoidosus.AAC.11
MDGFDFSERQQTPHRQRYADLSDHGRSSGRAPAGIPPSSSMKLTSTSLGSVLFASPSSQTSMRAAGTWGSNSQTIGEKLDRGA